MHTSRINTDSCLGWLACKHCQLGLYHAWQQTLACAGLCTGRPSQEDLDAIQSPFAGTMMESCSVTQVQHMPLSLMCCAFACAACPMLSVTMFHVVCHQNIALASCCHQQQHPCVLGMFSSWPQTPLLLGLTDKASNAVLGSVLLPAYTSVCLPAGQGHRRHVPACQ